MHKNKKEPITGGSFVDNSLVIVKQSNWSLKQRHECRRINARENTVP